MVGQPVPVRVTFFDPGVQGPQSVYLEVPSGLAMLSTSELQLSDGQSAEVVLTPQQASVQADDIVLVAFNGPPQLQQVIGQAAATALDKIVISTGVKDNTIRATDTPATMKDRIPPREYTPYTVKFVGAKPAANTIVLLNITGQSNLNGRAALLSNSDKLDHASLFLFPGLDSEYQGNIRGTLQTVPGNAGQLVMALFRKVGTAIKESASFSIAVIPIAEEFSAPITVKGANRSHTRGLYKAGFGARYVDTFLSDSGRPTDLDQVMISEKVSSSGTGSLKKDIAVSMTGFLPPQKQKFDFHTLGVTGRNRADSVARLRTFFQDKGSGTLTMTQYENFYDKRTGMNQGGTVPIEESGFYVLIELKSGRDGMPAVFATKMPLGVGEVKVLPGRMAAAAQATLEDKIQ